MSRRKGFTVVELLVVIAVLAILAALCIPIFGLRHRGPVGSTRNASNLKQLHLAVTLYRHDYDLHSAEQAQQVDIDPILVFARKRAQTHYGVTYDIAVSACKKHPYSLTDAYYPFVGATDTHIMALRRTLGEQSILFADDNCNPPDVRLQTSWVTRRGTGIYLDGSLANRYKSGQVSSFDFWHNPWEYKQ
ncbi:MAG: type II secretion system protein [Fimbriimonadaceae bacterium]|nr:type II secretion system protein [Fimbriimonadaceae bacterium]